MVPAEEKILLNTGGGIKNAIKILKKVLVMMKILY